MKLWHLLQDKVCGWDTFSDAVVAAESEEEARMIHPNDYLHSTLREVWNGEEDLEWAAARDVAVKYLGEAAPNIPKGVVCVSYHAG